MTDDNVTHFPVSELIRTGPSPMISVHPRRGKQSFREPYARGPFPLAWVFACRDADVNAIYVAIDILHRTYSNIDQPSGEWVAISEICGKRLGLSRYLRNKAIDGLEKSGLAQVERVPNHAPRVRLRAWSTNRLMKKSPLIGHLGSNCIDIAGRRK